MLAELRQRESELEAQIGTLTRELSAVRAQIQAALVLEAMPQLPDGMYNLYSCNHPRGKGTRPYPYNPVSATAATEAIKGEIYRYWGLLERLEPMPNGVKMHTRYGKGVAEWWAEPAQPGGGE